MGLPGLRHQTPRMRVPSRDESLRNGISHPASSQHNAASPGCIMRTVGLPDRFSSLSVPDCGGAPVRV
ncbi:hypothetical protein L841_2447 [Mycobacterium sp. MAC_080597_8934]|nr:hypothetical protein L839_1305 [Mycobacterium avium MAV_120809_2495]ETZ58239.1 hypothetical protein L840_2725 [Mycobacterium sp. MAC_011194_8550]ETZ68324.1 hypothetical protein L841_2447 [Mycobacterium sp. MAC_080597_8934]